MVMMDSGDLVVLREDNSVRYSTLGTAGYTVTTTTTVTTATVTTTVTTTDDENLPPDLQWLKTSTLKNLLTISLRELPFCKQGR